MTDYRLPEPTPRRDPNSQAAKQRAIRQKRREYLENGTAVTIAGNALRSLTVYDSRCPHSERVTPKELYAAYKQWLVQFGEDYVPLLRLSFFDFNRMCEQVWGWHRSRGPDNKGSVRWYRHRLLEPDEEPDQLYKEPWWDIDGARRGDVDWKYLAPHLRDVLEREWRQRVRDAGGFYAEGPFNPPISQVPSENPYKDQELGPELPA